MINITHRCIQIQCLYQVISEGIAVQVSEELAYHSDGVTGIRLYKKQDG